MNVVVATPTLVLVGVLLLSTWTDLKEHRIPNTLSLGGLVFALVGRSLVQGPLAGMQVGLTGACIGFLAFLPLYLLKGMGAGDVKLMAAVGAFLGPYPAFIAVTATALAGGAIAVAIIIFNRLNKYGWFGITAPVRQFPYGSAILIGTLFALWTTGPLALPLPDSGN